MNWQRKRICPMCQTEFMTQRGDAKTCSPRCRKRRERVLKGTALATWKMGEGPTQTSSKLWR